MSVMYKMFKKYWLLGFLVGVFACTLLFTQVLPFSVQWSADNMVARITLAISEADCCGGFGGGPAPNGEPESPAFIPPPQLPPPPEIPPPPPAPGVCDSFTAAPTQLPHGGGNVTLQWQTTNSPGPSISGIGGVNDDGQLTVFVSQTTTFVMTVPGHKNIVGQQGAADQCQATVVVQKKPPPPPPPVCDISAHPSQIQQGQSSTLSWSSSNATSATLSTFGSVALNGSTSVSPSTTTFYTLTVTGPGGTANCQTKVKVIPPSEPNLPSCTLTANPTSIQQGQSSTLSWTSTNATSATLTTIGSVALNGSTSVSPSSTTTYVLTVTGPGGTANCHTTIGVVPVEPNIPACTISAQPTSIQQGQSSTLSWTSTNATSATLTSIGSVALNGSTSVSPQSTTTYVLTVTGPGGTANCQTTIGVLPVEPNVPFCTISANPSSIQQGQSSTLTWTSSNATSATLSTFGSVALSGSQTVTPSGTTTYVLMVTGPGGSANCQTTVHVNTNNVTPSCSIHANPSNIQYGQSSTLTWSSSNAVSATLSNVGSVATNGSRTVQPFSTQTYVLTVFSSTGQSAQCQTTVHVGTVHNNPPSCWITLTPQYHSSPYNYNNQSAHLQWGSNNATSAFISPNIGSVSTSGSRTVYTNLPAQAGGYVQYTLTVHGSGGSATCRTANTFTPPPPTYNPPHVTLTQIPYTGIDLGPVGASLYYLAILVFALSAGYLMVYYLPAFRAVKARVPEEIMEAPMLFAKSVAQSAPLAYATQSVSDWGTKDTMSFARSENGRAPRIVISRR